MADLAGVQRAARAGDDVVARDAAGLVDQHDAVRRGGCFGHPSSLGVGSAPDA